MQQFCTFIWVCLLYNSAFRNLLFDGRLKAIKYTSRFFKPIGEVLSCKALGSENPGTVKLGFKELFGHHKKVP